MLIDDFFITTAVSMELVQACYWSVNDIGLKAMSLHETDAAHL